MKRYLSLVFVSVLLCQPLGLAQQPTAPDIPFTAEDMLKMPPDLYVGEVAGVASNSKRQIFVYTRTGADDGSTILEPRSARVFEFKPDGTFVKEIGKNLYSKGWAHAVRVDREDNIWLVDNGSDEVVKLGPDYRVKLILGRRPEPVAERVRRAGMEQMRTVPPPRPGYFYEPTDVAFDPQGNIFVSDGYQNSSVHKFDKDGHNVKMVGTTRGSGPGQFSTPHGIAVDARGLVYVADRSNGRIQILDNDLNYKGEIKYVPQTPAGYVAPIPAFGTRPDGTYNSLWPNTLCISPGTTQYIYTHSMIPGQIQKFTLDGKLVGQFGTAGRKVGQFGWIHALACVSENEVWTGELLNWRVQKLTLRPGQQTTSSGARR